MACGFIYSLMAFFLMLSGRIRRMCMLFATEIMYAKHAVDRAAKCTGICKRMHDIFNGEIRIGVVTYIFSKTMSELLATAKVILITLNMRARKRDDQIIAVKMIIETYIYKT